MDAKDGTAEAAFVTLFPLHELLILAESCKSAKALCVSIHFQEQQSFGPVFAVI